MTTSETSAGRIAVVGSGPLRLATTEWIESFGHRVVDAPDAENVDLVLVVAEWVDASVLETVRDLKRRLPSTLVVPRVRTSDGSQAVELFRAGAWDVLLEPVDRDTVERMVHRAVDIRSQGRERRLLAERLEQEKARVEDLRRRFGGDDPFVSVLGPSEAMRSLVETLREVARSDSTVLVTGESGTGKGLIARAIHDASSRRDGPFVEANCVVYSESLLHSELFGHERGAFTGALRQKKGRFELARGGTIFLDEIGEISAATQLFLLRVLQDQSFERVGGEETIRSDVRVIAATNADLEDALERGKFRRDLYYRLNVIPVKVPPLRERAEDVPVLASAFLRRCTERTGSEVEGFADEAIERLTRYRWPGNVRELQNLVERLVVMAKGRLVNADDLPRALREEPGSAEAPRARTLRHLEMDRIREALRQTGGNKKRAAAILGIHRATLYAKLDRYGITPESAPVPVGAETDVDLPLRSES